MKMKQEKMELKTPKKGCYNNYEQLLVTTGN